MHCHSYLYIVAAIFGYIEQALRVFGLFIFSPPLESISALGRFAVATESGACYGVKFEAVDINTEDDLKIAEYVGKLCGDEEVIFWGR